MTESVVLNLGNTEVEIKVSVKEIEKAFNGAKLEDKDKLVNFKAYKCGENKRKYIRTKEKNDKNLYSEEVIEINVGGQSFYKVETKSKYINGIPNKNYCKGQYVYNRTGKNSKYGYIVAMYLGSEKEGKDDTKEPKFHVILLDENMKLTNLTSRYLVSKAEKEEAIIPEGYLPVSK